MEQIRRVAKKAQLNIGMKRTVKYVADFVLIAGATGLAVSIVSLFVPIIHETVAVLILIAIGVVAGVIAGIIKRPTLREAALILDSKGLKEHVSTALENEGSDNMFAEMQREETRKLIDDIDVNMMLKTKPDHRKLAAILLFFGVAVVIFNVPCLSHEKSELIEQVLSSKDDIKDDPKLDEQTKDLLADAIDKAAKEMNKVKSSKELNDVKDRLEKKMTEALKKETAEKDRHEDSGVGTGNNSQSGNDKGNDHGENSDGADGSDNADDSGESFDNGGDSASGSSITPNDVTDTHGAKVSKTEGQYVGNYTEGQPSNISEDGTQSGENGNRDTDSGTGTGSETDESDGSGSGSGKGEGKGKGQGTGNESSQNGGSGGGTGYDHGSKNGVERKVDEDSEKLLLSGETTGGGGIDGTVLDGQIYSSDDTIRGDGKYGTEIDYGSVVQDYEDRAISRIESGRIASEYRDLIKNYYTGINK